MEEAERAGRRIPLVVWSITGLWCAVLLAYSILMPMFRAPDEPHHIDLANLFAEEQTYPDWDERNLGTGLQSSLRWVRFGSGSENLATDEAPHRGDRPSFDDLTAPRDTSVNQQPQHPPLYYVIAGTAGWAARLVVDDPAFDLEGWIYRLVSVAMVAPLPLVIWHVARRVGLPPVVGVAATLIPLANPQLAHMGAAVNNDSLMILAFWLLTPIVLRLADGELTWKVGALAGLVTGIGLLTKGFALVMPLWVLGALLLAWRRGGPDRFRPAFATAVVYGGVTLVTGGWWWVRNLVVYQELSPSRFSEMVPNAEHVDVHLGNFLQTWATATTRRFWGEFGWFDVSIPSLAVGTASVLAVVGLVVGCRRRDRVVGSLVGNRVLLVAPLLLLIALQLFLAFRGYLLTGRMPGLQGRYWFGSLAGFAVVASIGFANVLRRGTRYLPLSLFGGALVMQAAGTLTILGYYWGRPDDGLGDQLRSVVAWAPIEGEVVGAGAVLGAVILVATLAQLVHLTWRPPAEQTDAAVPAPASDPVAEADEPEGAPAEPQPQLPVRPAAV